MTRAALATLATTAITAAALPASALAGITLLATTTSAQDVTATSATLKANVAVSALGAAVTWQYGPTADYGLTSGQVSTGLLGVDQKLSIGVTGLTPATTYHVRAIATSGLSIAYGKDVSFTTAAASGGSTGSGSSDSSGSSGSSESSDSGSSGSGSSGSGASGSGSSGSSGSGGSGETPAPSPGQDGSTSSSSGAGAGSATSEGGATVAPGVATTAVTPVLGHTVAVATVHGTVTAAAPGGAAVDLATARSVPTGTLIDTRSGTVELKAALDRTGATQTARFWGGRFEVRQSTATRGLTQLVLRGADFSGCPAAAVRANSARVPVATGAAKHKRPSRSLWGSDSHGRFQTRGRGSVATVRGTRWSTRDTCAGTLTTVTAGAVAVHDLRRHRTILVRHGHHYLARVAR